MFLKDALSHAIILQEVPEICKIKFLTARIDYLEGTYKQALEGLMECYRMSPSVRLWGQIAPLTVDTLLGLNQIQDVHEFLNKLSESLQTMKDQSNFTFDHQDIRDTLGICMILKAHLAFAPLKTKFSFSQFSQGMDLLKQMESTVTGVHAEVLRQLLKLLNKLSLLLERQAICDPEALKKIFKSQTALIDRLWFIESQIKDSLKYTAILEQQSFEVQVHSFFT